MEREHRASRIRNYRPEDRNQVLDMFGRLLGKETQVDQEFLWEWKHALDDTATLDNNKSIVMDRDGSVVGYFGTIPTSFKLKDTIVEGIYIMDMLTDSENQGRGSGIRLVKHQLDHMPLGIGSALPRSTELWRRLSKRETIVIKHVKKLVCVVDPFDVLRGRGVPTPFARPAGFLWRRLTKIRRLHTKQRRGENLVLESIDAFPDAIDDFSREFSEGFPFMAVRDARFLNWRFVSCPFRYEKRLLRDQGRIRGYMVFRPALLNGRRVLLLIEIVACDDQARHYRLMLAELLQIADRYRVSDIQTLDSGCLALSGELKRLGFFTKQENSPIISQVSDELAGQHDIYRKQDWFLSAADGEFEFIFFKQGVQSVLRSTN